ncbi:MAG: repeat-containing proteinYVTN family beta-propeller repeat protein [Bryobacterales bacterium]|nr:repeat-containing proteinYVTN family beta-propeller repeat protein [Bryobacterales bacterium]
MKNKLLLFIALAVISGIIPCHAQSNPTAGLPLPPPDDFPDIPSPDDPPPMFDDFPPPLTPDEFDFPDPWDIPFPGPFDIPDIPDLPDPFSSPSDFDLELPVLGHSPVAFTPEPLPLPFFPSFAGTNGTTSQVRACDPARDTRIFLPDQRGQVDVLGTCPQRNLRTIPLHFQPNGVRADRAGAVLIVTSLDSPEVAIIDAETYTVSYVSLSSSFGDIFASSVAFSADGSLAYIANHSASKPFVAIFDMASRRVTTTLTGIGPFPSKVAVSPDGTMLWVSCRGDGTLHVFDTRTNAKIAMFNVIRPLGITFNPTGTRAFVAAANDFAPGTIEVFDAEKLTRITSIPTGFVPQTILISPTGRHGFVNNLNSSFITQFDPVRLTFVRNINTKAAVSGMGFIRR